MTKEEADGSVLDVVIHDLNAITSFCAAEEDAGVVSEGALDVEGELEVIVGFIG